MDAADGCGRFVKTIVTRLTRLFVATGNRAARAFRQRPRAFRAPPAWPDMTEAMIALARAWSVTTIALTLLLAALALAPLWDPAIFMQALHQALSGDSRMM